MQVVSIIVIGNDILEGLTLDTNSHWLCEFLTGIGGKVRRVVEVPDNVEEIGAEVKACQAGGALLVFTVGGLGPMADDVTLRAVSAELGLELAFNEQAYQFITEGYRRLYSDELVESPEMTEARRKMAMLPEGSRPLRNPLGVAPGVIIETPGEAAERTGQIAGAPGSFGSLSGKGLVVICLPGQPAEMKAIVESSLADDLAKRFGLAAYLREDFLTDCRDESMLAGALAELRGQFPQVSLKSHPERVGQNMKVRISVSCAADTWDHVHELMAKATARLSKRLATQRILLHSLVDHKESAPATEAP